MTDREKNLRAGAKEQHGPFTLYWEAFAYRLPGMDEHEIGHAFTIDGPEFRGRYVTLAAADADLDALKRQVARQVAINALLGKGDSIKILRPPEITLKLGRRP